MAPRQTMLIKGEDGEMIECEVISTTEKESSFQKSAPIINPTLAGLFCFLNLIPGFKKINKFLLKAILFVCLGFGTFLAAHTLLCGKKCSYTSPIKGYFVGLLAAFLQLISSALIIGWFWSLW